MKITLIRPTDHYSSAHPLANMRPLGLFMLASALDKAGFQVEVLDLQIEKNKSIPLDQLIFERESEIFGITALTASRFEAIDIAKSIRKIYPQALIVVGGAHFTFCAQDTLAHVEAINIVVKGLGLTAIVEIARAVEMKQGFNNIQSIVYRSEGSIIENQILPPSVDVSMINDLPVYTNFNVNDYWENLRGYSEPVPAMSIITSVGCTGQCVFCAQLLKHYSTRSCSSVLNDIEFMKDHFGINAFNIVDMTFTANPRHVKELCHGIIKRDLQIKWWCESRVDISLELLKLMKDAGCVSIAAGVESGSDRILAQVSKGITREKIRKFCKACDDLRMDLRLFFMYSHIDETIEEISESLALAHEMQQYSMVKVVTFQPTMIFPGTRLELISRKRNLLREDFSWYDQYDCDLNRELGQIPNIPLFIDRLSKEDMIKISENAKQIFERVITKKNTFKSMLSNVLEIVNKIKGK